MARLYYETAEQTVPVPPTPFVSEGLQKADGDFYLTAKYILTLSNKAPKIFEDSELTVKRQLLKLLLQNCVVDSATLIPTIRSPFNLFVEGAFRQEWLVGVDAKRTTHHEWAPLLVRMKKWRGAHGAKLFVLL